MIKKQRNQEKDSLVVLPLPLRRPFNFAHVLTSARLVLLPFFLFAIEAGRQESGLMPVALVPAALVPAAVVTGLFLLICASDYYDGPLARAQGLDSDLGKVLDNLADITFLLVTLTYLMGYGVVPWWIPTAIALAFSRYSIDSWLLSKKSANITLVSNPIGHWAGVLNYIFTGVASVHATLHQQLLPAPLYQTVLACWFAYLLLAMGMRLHFFLQAQHQLMRDSG
jgi:phosphatidylglycerophosphate synthase